MKNKTLSRRQFLTNSGFALLAVQVATLLPREVRADVNDPKSLEARAAQGQTIHITSGKSAFFPAADHLHTIDIPVEAILRPPREGLRISTSSAYFHHHVVKLTQLQLAAIAAGKTVTVEDTVHDHHYTIALAAIR
jgi:hypothetical protein